MYRIVTGEGAGEQWSGTRNVPTDGVDPIDFVPADSPLEDSVRTRRDRARAAAARDDGTGS
jgi:hypothetical protein